MRQERGEATHYATASVLAAGMERLHTPLMKKSYRPNVAAILQNHDGLVLIGQRSDYRENWQFPQGGVDRSECLEDAVRREVLEEIALAPSFYEIIEQRGPYRYDFPKGKDARGFCGQEQTYFLCRLREKSLPVLDLHQSCGEFVALRWVAVKDFPVHLAPPMKQGVYREVLRDFFGISKSV